MRSNLVGMRAPREPITASLLPFYLPSTFLLTFYLFTQPSTLSLTYLLPFYLLQLDFKIYTNKFFNFTNDFQNYTGYSYKCLVLMVMNSLYSWYTVGAL